MNKEKTNEIFHLKYLSGDKYTWATDNRLKGQCHEKSFQTETLGR